jgi:tetratricopeptide (TPR) repeat protein
MNEISSSKKDESIKAALAAMKVNRPLRAEEICRDYLHLNPGCVHHLRLLGHTLMKQNRLADAEEQLHLALKIRPGFPHLHEDMGSVLAMQKRYEESIPYFEKAIKLEPALPLAHKKLGQALVAVGRGEDADESFQEFFEQEPLKGEIAIGLEHMKEERSEEAIKVFQKLLKEHPDNVDVMRHLAVVFWKNQKNLANAEALLRRATNLAPDYTVAWLNLGAVLLDKNQPVAAIDCYQEATRLEPKNPAAWAGLGNAQGLAAYPDKSVQAYAKSLSLNPGAAGAQMGYAHVLKTVGDQAGALKAYRAAVEIKPDFGEVYWSMANLKIFNFEEQEVSAMLTQLENEDLSESAEYHIRFALGKAYEDKKDYESAWKYYHSGNQLKRTEVYHDPVFESERCTNIAKVFSHEFLEENTGSGFEADDPILIVGLPRSGSTLVEQILASHSQVEGTSELPILSKVAESVGRYRPDDVSFPLAAPGLRKKDWRAYGQQYMEDTRRHRLTDKPFFTDKLPNNFSYVGFLHLILPNARVINARRHPFDSCLGTYKQLWGTGQFFTYDMFDLAEYYSSYDDLMKHWHEVLPGKILDVHYEETVLDLETQVRRILDFCGLPFEESCVRYYETDRAVRTASSEQVRQPIYTGALGKWRQYEKHLDIWKEELGDIVEALPEAVRRAGEVPG